MTVSLYIQPTNARNTEHGKPPSKIQNYVAQCLQTTWEGLLQDSKCTLSKCTVKFIVNL
jgi:hypothetical protein